MRLRHWIRYQPTSFRCATNYFLFCNYKGGDATECTTMPKLTMDRVNNNFPYYKPGPKPKPAQAQSKPIKAQPKPGLLSPAWPGTSLSGGSTMILCNAILWRQLRYHIDWLNGLFKMIVSDKLNSSNRLVWWTVNYSIAYSYKAKIFDSDCILQRAA